MKFNSLSVQVAAAILACVTLSRADLNQQKELNKRQIGQAVIDTQEDRDASGSHFHAGAVSGGKYFQYTHVPAKDHYEFGHRRGNEHHFIERHEKAHPHAGEFKTKVRWGDKHGGYGEHYWDYNHAGHGGDGHGEETQEEPEYASYEATEQKPSYTQQLAQLNQQRARRGAESEESDVEFINKESRSLAAAGLTGKHGGNYRAVPFGEREKREDEKFEISDLVYDPSSGRIVNQRTGRAYTLNPVY